MNPELLNPTSYPRGCRQTCPLLWRKMLSFKVPSETSSCFRDVVNLSSKAVCHPRILGKMVSISGHKLHRDVGVYRIISRSLLFRDFSICFGQGNVTCLPSSQKRGHEIEWSGRIDAAVKSCFCWQRGWWDWCILGAMEVLCPSGFHLCDLFPCYKIK